MSDKGCDRQNRSSRLKNVHTVFMQKLGKSLAMRRKHRSQLGLNHGIHVE